MSSRYKHELADAESRESMSSAVAAAGVHHEIGAPGAGLGVNRIIDGVEGDRGTTVLPLVSCSFGCGNLSPHELYPLPILQAHECVNPRRVPASK